MDEIRVDRVMALVWRRLALVSMAAGAAVLLLVTAVPLAVGAVREPSSSNAAPLVGPAGPSVVHSGERLLSANERTGMLESLIAATYRVSANSCGSVVIGTGFAVGELLVTNSHVAGDASTLVVDQPSGPLREQAGGLAISVAVPEIDFAAADAPAVISATGLSWSDDLPAVGEPVMLAGYGGGRELSVLEAMVHAVVDGRAYGNDGPVILFDQTIVAGFSGGPVVDRDGQVLGVLRAYDSLTGLTIATPSAVMVDAIGSYNMSAESSACN